MEPRRTVGLFLLVSLVFGTGTPAVKSGLAFMPPLLFAASRSFLTAGMLLVYVVLTKQYWYPRIRGDWVAVLSGGVFLVGGTGIGFVAQQDITAGVAAIIFSLSPIVTAALAWVLLPEERLGPRDYVGILLGFVGMAVIIGPDAARLLDPTVFGKLLFFGGVVVVTLGTVLIRRSGASMPVTALTAWAMAVGGVVHVIVAVGVGESVAAIDPTPMAILLVVYLAAVVGAFGLVAFLVLMGDIGPLKANLTTYLTPVVAIGIGWAVLDEAVQPLAILGFLIIASGFVLLERRAIGAELLRYRTLFP